MPNMPMMPGTPVVIMQPQPQPQPGWANPVPQVPAAPPRVAMPAPPAPAKLTMPSPPGFAAAPADQGKPKFRAASPATDPPIPPAPPRLTLPSPEALGIRVDPPAAPAAVVDWNQVHARLEQLGVVNFHRDRLPQGGFRIVLALATHQVEGTGATESAAMLVALQRAEGLVAAPR
jgi:hypothetical protein